MAVAMLWRSILLLPVLGIAATATSIDTCPGYTLINVAESDSQITGDLILAGSACNTYGEDLSYLKLLVEYQTGRLIHTIKRE